MITLLHAFIVIQLSLWTMIMNKGNVNAWMVMLIIQELVNLVMTFFVHFVLTRQPQLIVPYVSPMQPKTDPEYVTAMMAFMLMADPVYLACMLVLIVLLGLFAVHVNPMIIQEIQLPMDAFAWMDIMKME